MRDLADFGNASRHLGETWERVDGEQAAALAGQELRAPSGETYRCVGVQRLDTRTELLAESSGRGLKSPDCLFAGIDRLDRVIVQPVSIAYVNYGGIPVGRALRDKVAWYGEADLVPHLLNILAAGAVDVTVSWGEPVPYDMSADRKKIARDAEASVRRMTARALRSSPQPVSIPGAAPSSLPAFEQT